MADDNREERGSVERSEWMRSNWGEVREGGIKAVAYDS